MARTGRMDVGELLVGTHFICTITHGASQGKAQTLLRGLAWTAV